MGSDTGAAPTEPQCPSLHDVPPVVIKLYANGECPDAFASRRSPGRMSAGRPHVISPDAREVLGWQTISVRIGQVPAGAAHAAATYIRGERVADVTDGG